MAVSRRLRRLVAQVPDPRDCFEGTRSPGGVRPENVLLFHRPRLAEATRPHHHHRFVLIPDLEGAGEVILDEVFYRLRPGEALLVFPYQFHRYRCGPIRWLYVTFEGVSP